MSSSSSSSASTSGIMSAHNATTSLPKPDRSSPQSSLPGSTYFLRFLGFIPASLSAFSLAFCRSRASVGNAEVGGGVQHEQSVAVGADVVGEDDEEEGGIEDDEKVGGIGEGEE